MHFNLTSSTRWQYFVFIIRMALPLCVPLIKHCFIIFNTTSAGFTNLEMIALMLVLCLSRKKILVNWSSYVIDSFSELKFELFFRQRYIILIVLSVKRSTLSICWWALAMSYFNSGWLNVCLGVKFSHFINDRRLSLSMIIFVYISSENWCCLRKYEGANWNIWTLQDIYTFKTNTN